jgi:hypothetical protein
MTAKKKKIRICGLYVPTKGAPESYGGGNIYLGARDIGSVVRVSVATAKMLLASVQARPRLPRPGWETKLCGSTYLRMSRDGWEVQVLRSGGFRGTGKQRRGKS